MTNGWGWKPNRWFILYHLWLGSPLMVLHRMRVPLSMLPYNNQLPINEKSLPTSFFFISSCSTRSFRAHARSLQTHSVWANAERSEAQKNIKFDASLWEASPRHGNAGWHFPLGHIYKHRQHKSTLRGSQAIFQSIGAKKKLQLEKLWNNNSLLMWTYHTTGWLTHSV